MPAELIQIAIVEDDPQFLGEVGLLLEGSPSLEVVGQFTRGREAIEGIVEKRPRVALIDLGLPDLSGVEVIRAVSERGSGTELLALTVYDDDDHLFAALRAGAVGYIVKGEMSLPEVLKTVEDVIGGRASMSMGLARRILEAFREVPRKEQKAELQGLTERELDPSGRCGHFMGKGVQGARLDHRGWFRGDPVFMGKAK